MHNGLAHDDTLSALSQNGSSRKILVDITTMLDVGFGKIGCNITGHTVILCWPEDAHCASVLRKECRDRAIFVTDYTLAVQYGREFSLMCV